MRRVGSSGAIFFGEPAVVGAHDGFISIVIFDAPPKFRSALLRREEYFGVDAVAILFADALLGAAGAWRAFISTIERDVVVASLAAVEIGGRRGTLDRLADDPRIASVGLANRVAARGRDAFPGREGASALSQFPDGSRRKCNDNCFSRHLPLRNEFQFACDQPARSNGANG